MMISRRSTQFLGFIWAPLLILGCCSCAMGWAESSERANPLRRRGPTSNTVTQASSERGAPPARAATVRAASATQTAPAAEPQAGGAVSRVTRARLRARRAVRPASYSLFASAPRRSEITETSEPEAQLVSQTTGHEEDYLLSDDIIVEGIYQKMPQEFPGEMVLGKGWGSDCCDGAGCSVCISCPRISFENLEVFGGVQGFTGPKNRGSNGSFGFDVGFNWGTALPCSSGCLGMQFGLRSAHSNFSGAEFTADDRNQLFLTGGLFRRVDWGLQGGLVVDYLSDNWYTETDLVQLRGELGWVYPHGHEFGVWFTAHTQSDTALSNFSGAAPSLSEVWEATDLFAFYYRKRVCNATGRFYAGFTNDSDGLVGGDLRLPLSDNWAVESGFTYLIPEQARTGLAGGGHEQESWNLGINLVWYPGCLTDCDYYRPLFNVADNGSFMVDRR